VIEDPDIETHACLLCSSLLLPLQNL